MARLSDVFVLPLSLPLSLLHGVFTHPLPSISPLAPKNISQNPLAITAGVNSSVDITCSTTIKNPFGLSLQRRFQRNSEKTDVMYLAFKNGEVIKVTKAPEFKGRLQHRQSGEGWEFTLTLSLLGLYDTDLYYCSWNEMDSQTYRETTYPSNGTVIIVKGENLQPFVRKSITKHIYLTLLLVTFSPRYFSSQKASACLSPAKISAVFLLNNIRKSNGLQGHLLTAKQLVEGKLPAAEDRSYEQISPFESPAQDSKGVSTLFVFALYFLYR
uniref:Immunoglobulin V-set domain-containing protein n=1 Tax=Sphaeramia orbicularis TaxID=375764 RepID=A0A673CWZ5_9TELE